MFRFTHRFNWKESKPHLLLLSKFIHAQDLKYFGNQERWTRVLNEPPQKAIQRFVDEGMIVNADLDALISYKYKVTELKDLLKLRKLTLSGTKDELIHRLVQTDKEVMMKSVAGTELLTCTQIGSEIAEQYIASEREKRIKVEQQAINYLTKRMFKEASLVVANYEAEQVFPRGMGIDWKHYNPKRDIEILNLVFNNRPKILSKLEDAKLESLRIGAAMMELWGENAASKWLPPNFEIGLSMDNDSAARMLLFRSQNEENLDQFRQSGVAQYVEILATSNSCEFCKKLQGKRYKLGEAPELPNPNCTHEMGCRCVYLPCVD